MNQIRATARTSPLAAVRRLLIVLLAVGAVLIGLLALHTVTGAHAGVPAVPLGSAQQAHPDNAAITGVAAVASFQQGVDALPLFAGD